MVEGDRTVTTSVRLGMKADKNIETCAGIILFLPSIPAATLRMHDVNKRGGG